MTLAAQEILPVRELLLDLRTGLGATPTAKIRLASGGRLLLARSQPPVSKPRQSLDEATVEVWDLLPLTSQRQETFDQFRVSLRERLSRALELPPPSHQALELAEIMVSDPSNPQKLDLTRVQSMQERFNRLPPNGSLAR
jgi:hypothetical protein